MSYQSLIEQSLDALYSKLSSISTFGTVAMAVPEKLNLTRMPAAYILLEKDSVSRKTEFLEFHTLTITLSIIRNITGTKHSDIEVEKGFHNGLTLIGAVYDALTADRSLGGKTGPIEIKAVDYGQAPLDSSVVFWGEFSLETTLRYAPGKPAAVPLIEEVYTEAGRYP